MFRNLKSAEELIPPSRCQEWQELIVKSTNRVDCRTLTACRESLQGRRELNSCLIWPFRGQVSMAYAASQLHAMFDSALDR